MTHLPPALLRQALLDLAIDVPIQRVEFHEGRLTLTLYGGSVRTWSASTPAPAIQSPKKNPRKHAHPTTPGSSNNC